MSNSLQNQFTFLDFIDSKKLANWSVKYLIESEFDYNKTYDLAPIRTLLKRNKTQINIQNDVLYKRVTIKINNGGIYLRDIEQGDRIGTKKQFTIQQGQFLLSKIDARNGAFGVVPEEVDGGIITGNFWTYDVDYSRVDPHYLSLITTTPQFINFCQRSSAGTTNRNYLQENLFLNEKIPLPNIQEQRELVNSFKNRVQNADKLVQEAKDFNQKLDILLGIETLPINSNIGKLSFIGFKELSKWGLDQIFSNHTNYNIKFKTLTISQLCLVGSGGTPSRANKSYYEGEIPWIKTSEVLDDVIYDTEEKITEEAIRNSSAKLYQKGSLVIAMYGQGKNRGRTAKLGVDATTNQACAVLHSFKDKVLVDYLWIYLMNEYDRLRALASGNNQPNLNADMIKNYPVVIPPIEIQEQIIKEHQEIKATIREKIEKAKSLKTEAIKDFGKAIFN